MPTPRNCRGCGRAAAIADRACAACGAELPGRLEDPDVRAATEAMLLAFQSEMSNPSGCSIAWAGIACIALPGTAFWWFARDSRWLWAVAAAVVMLLGVFLVFGLQLDREARKSFERVWRGKLLQFIEDEGLSKADLLRVAKEKLDANGTALRFLGEL